MTAEHTAPTKVTEVATVLVPVTDQDRSIAFYVRHLGFEKKMDVTFGSNRWVEVGPAGATTTLALATGGDLKPGVDTGVRLSTDDAAADHAALKAGGVTVDELLNWGGDIPPMFVFHDLDDNRLVIVQRPPRS
jgi:catechol 2,3-dioxygenase-like lactoylglutathione lyase family enzyme